MAKPDVVLDRYHYPKFSLQEYAKAIHRSQRQIAEDLDLNYFSLLRWARKQMPSGVYNRMVSLWGDAKMEPGPITKSPRSARLPAAFAPFVSTAPKATPIPEVAPVADKPTLAAVAGERLSPASTSGFREALEVAFEMVVRANEERQAALQVAERYKTRAFDLQTKLTEAERRILAVEDELRLANQLLSEQPSTKREKLSVSPEVEEIVRQTAPKELLDDLRELLPKHTGPSA